MFPLKALGSPPDSAIPIDHASRSFSPENPAFFKLLRRAAPPLPSTETPGVGLGVGVEEFSDSEEGVLVSALSPSRPDTLELGVVEEGVATFEVLVVVALPVLDEVSVPVDDVDEGATVHPLNAKARQKHNPKTTRLWVN